MDPMAAEVNSVVVVPNGSLAEEPAGRLSIESHFEPWLNGSPVYHARAAELGIIPESDEREPFPFDGLWHPDT